MNLPEELKYTRSHEWIRLLSDGSMQVGITDHAQESLGDLVFIETPPEGSQLKCGDACGVVESVKAASDLCAPISGIVLAINTELQTTPGKVNENAYSAWIYQIRPSDPAEVKELLNATQYQQQIDEE